MEFVKVMLIGKIANDKSRMANERAEFHHNTWLFIALAYEIPRGRWNRLAHL